MSPRQKKPSGCPNTTWRVSPRQSSELPAAVPQAIDDEMLRTGYIQQIYSSKVTFFCVVFFSNFCLLVSKSTCFSRPDPGRCWENLGWPRIKRLLPLEFEKIRPIRDQFAARNGPNGEAKCSIGAKALGGRLFFPRCVCDSGAETQCKWVAGCFRAVLYCAGPIMGAPLRFDG